jgi:peroxiredoxin
MTSAAPPSTGLSAEAPALAAGDPAPRIVALDHEGIPFYSHADLVTGRPLVLLFCPAVRDEAAAALCAVRDNHDAFQALGACVVAITRLPPEANGVVHADLRLPFKLLTDAMGDVSRAYGAGDTASVVILDGNHRIAGILSSGPAAAPAEAALRCLRETLPPRSESIRSHAPILLLPRVLDASDCGRLIELWHRPVHVWPSADGFRSEGHTREQGDFKVGHSGAYGQMTEYVVRDAAVQRFLDQRFNRRVAGEMRKAFQTGVSGREDYRIVRYDSASGGVLHAHRDNATKEIAHRRFTMTINLNAGEYQGGALRFREYGDHLYEVERGTAVIWSASLLHEVMPVTGGARFVLGVHMYGN